ncbi:MAG: DUF3179 domain-containing (seleno)protein [Myxococcota bacterium]
MRAFCFLLVLGVGCSDSPGLSGTDAGGGGVDSGSDDTGAAVEDSVAELRVTDGTSTWRVDGIAAEASANLRSIAGHNAFWFAWSVFNPGTELYNAEPVRAADIESEESCGVPCDEIFAGCPGRDCIPPLDSPTFVSETPDYLADDDLVMGVVTSEGPRAYPHNILWWHEVVNEEVGDEAFTITLCPLTGSGLRFDRRGFVEGETVRLGVSGLLYNSNLIMWDRESESLWSQMRLESIQGDNLGNTTPIQPVHEMTWRAWRSLHPDTVVIGPETGHRRDYTRYPYTRGGDYRTNNSDTFRQTNPLPDGQFANKDMVFGITLGAQRKGYVWNTLRAEFGARGVLNDEIDGTPVAIVFALDEWYVHAFEREPGVELSLVTDE